MLVRTKDLKLSLSFRSFFYVTGKIKKVVLLHLSGVIERGMKTSSVRPFIENLYEKYRSLNQGSPASYIPELSKVNPDLFAISIVDTDGEIFSVGDFKQNFTLQSASKPVVYGLALAQRGEIEVHSKVGVEPTGEAFNSIIELEEKLHRPFNPMINSGAIAMTGLVLGKSFDEKLQKILSQFEAFVGHPVGVDENVYISEKKTAHRNQAIAHLMKHFGVMEADIEETLNLYFKQCSILVNCQDLATLAATYASGGLQPMTKQKVLEPDSVTKTLSLMFTCGMYDTAGEWAFKIGLPAKSGVSGALFAVVPGRFGIAVYSPRIDEHGHSCRGQRVVEDLSKHLKAHIFQAGIK